MENVSWRINGIFKADAQKVANEIGDNNVTAEDIVEKARDEKSELHKCFEWDDTKAAENWRKHQARVLLSMLVIKPAKEEHAPVRVFSLTSERQVYQKTEVILKQADEYQSMLKRALLEMESYRRKYHTLTELEDVFKAIDDLAI